MTLDQAVSHYLTARAMAHALGIKPHTVSEWKDGLIPPVHQMRLESLTRGALRADDEAWSPAKPRFTKLESRRAALNLEIFKLKS